MTTTSATAYARPILAAQPSTAPATAAYGAIAGTLVVSAYAAVEMMVFGPFNMHPMSRSGRGTSAALVPYVLIYAALGALTGVIVGFVLARTGRQRHHVLPTLSAVLMVVFVANAWMFGFGPRRTVFSPCCCRWQCGCCSVSCFRKKIPRALSSAAPGPQPS